MFLLLSQSNPYFEETNNNQNNQMAHKDLEGIEIDLKDRYKEQEKIMKFHHSEDNSFEAKEELITSEDEEESEGDSSQNNSSSLISLNSENKLNKKLKEKRSITLKKEDQMKLYQNTKLSRFKLLSKIFDLAGIIIIIFTHILSQIEDDEFYSYNKETRISGSILLNYLYTNDSENITWNDVFDDERVNLRKIFFLCLENENETLHKKYPKQIKEYMEKNNIKDFHNMTNSEILDAYEISQNTFGYESDDRNINDNGQLSQSNNIDNIELTYSGFNFDLKISDLSNKLRITILILTIISFLLFFLSWYLQFFIEEELDKMQKQLNKEVKPENEETKDNTLGQSNNTNNFQKRHF